MNHRLALVSLAALTAWLLIPCVAVAGGVSGQYLEVRSCDVYTGPCFANAEVGAAGRDAILAWQIDEGSHNGVETRRFECRDGRSCSRHVGFLEVGW